MARKNSNHYNLDEPLLLHRPKTRRDFIAQGFMTGAGSLAGVSAASLLMSAQARAEFTLGDQLAPCGISLGAGKIPFICFDLAGGANIAGSNVLVGGSGGQMDFISSAGFNKQGVPGTMLPGQTEGAPTVTSNGDFTDTTLGLAFHSDSPMLAGILEKFQVDALAPKVNGAVFAARSENDTQNNPHNPMYAINMAGADGDLLTLIGSRASESGGNSMAPAMLVNNEALPTKVDRPSDVTGLVDVGDFGDLSSEEVVAVMESVYRISRDKLDLSAVSTGLSNDQQIKDRLACAYVKAAYLADSYPSPEVLDPFRDTHIVGNGAGSIFSCDEFNDREFQKTASIMKMVISGRAGAGTVSMGGYDYHTGERVTGEQRDLRAGRCMGACLEYARRLNMPLAMYVFSDGSVFSNGAADGAANGKLVWTGDSQQTAAAFMLVYDPNSDSRPAVRGVSNAGLGAQVGFMRASGDVETSSSPAANNVNLLVQSIMLNYMALHGSNYASEFEAAFAARGLRQGLGSPASLDALTAFEPILPDSAEGRITVGDPETPPDVATQCS